MAGDISLAVETARESLANIVGDSVTRMTSSRGKNSGVSKAPMIPIIPTLFYAVGVASLVALSALTGLAGDETRKRLQEGEVSKITLAYPYPHEGKPVTTEDLAAIARKTAGIMLISPVNKLNALIGWDRGEAQAVVIGVTQDFFTINRLDVSRGRVLVDLDKNMNYCVLGSSVYKKLSGFGASPDPGNTLTIAGTSFMVLGVLPDEGESPKSLSFNNLVITHAKTLERLGMEPVSGLILAKTFDGLPTDKVAFALRNELKVNLHNTPVTVIHGEAIMKQLDAQKKTMAATLGVIGAVTLLAGGLGLISALIGRVNSRKEEIAVRSLYGGRGIDIIGKFGLDGLVWAIGGGIAGVVAGVIATEQACLFLRWGYSFPSGVVQVSIIIAVCGGALFAIYPSSRALQIDAASYFRMAQSTTDT